MSFWNNLGVLGIILTILLVVLGIWFAVVTAILIATAVGATGLDWWIVVITIFGALGGCGGSLIKISGV